jgi:nucleoside-diphosphate-sugar epimerase
MKAAVVGATGFLGSYVAEQLRLAGHDVIAITRAGSDTQWLKRWQVPAVPVDFSDPASMAGALAGREVVYNCVANPRVQRAPGEWGDVEVVLTRRIAEAAARAGARRLVQLSTVKIYGWRLPAQAVDETWPCRPEFEYEKMFVERERAVQTVAADTGIELVILRPAGAFGARYPFFARLCEEHRRGTFSVIGDPATRSSFIDARDIGRAMVWLGELPKAAGEIYLVRGFEGSWLDLKLALDAVHGKPARLRRLPVPAALVIGTLLEWFADWNEARAARHDSRDGGGRAKQDARAEGRRVCGFTPRPHQPPLSRLIVRFASSPALFNDAKLRATGFRTEYDLATSITDHAREMLRQQT